MSPQASSYDLIAGRFPQRFFRILDSMFYGLNGSKIHKECQYGRRSWGEMAVFVAICDNIPAH